MKTYRHVYLDFPDFTQESYYEIKSKVTFQDGIEDEIITMVVCDDPYYAMKITREFILSNKDWLVTEVHGQSFGEAAALVAKPEVSQSKYAVVCDNIKRIFYEGGHYEEIEHYSVINTTPNNPAVYHGTFDTKEVADERCAKLNKKWESVLESRNENALF